MEILIGAILLWGAIPFGIGFGLVKWAGKSNFPTAVLQGMAAVVVSVIVGLFLLNKGHVDYEKGVYDRIEQNRQIREATK